MSEQTISGFCLQSDEYDKYKESMNTYGRKPFEVEMRRNKYKSHLKKLQEISSSDSHLQKTLRKERQ